MPSPDNLLSHPAGMLHLEYTLTNGQLFRWRKVGADRWDVVTGGDLLSVRLVETTSVGKDIFACETYPEPGREELVRSFFRLDVDLEPVYASWREADPYLGSLADRFRGLRLVLQQPEECLLSFICSTANFIPRIMIAVSTIARLYGDPICAPDGRVLTHAFPKASVIAPLDPEQLSAETGLEWRAANLIKVAKQLAERPLGWLEEVGKLDYASARAELMRLDGVGPKIADCVCLFALGKDQAVPVDTHVWQLTREHYLPNLRGKSLTSASYVQVVNFYQGRFVKAGWAQQYLFYDHLLRSRASSSRGRG